MTFSLSVVQLCPEIHRGAADAIAESYGYGPGNLSVRLTHTDTSTWWGCHAWWRPEALDIVTTPPDEVAGVADIMAIVITSVREGGEPIQHWAEVLAANGLSVYVEPEA